MPKMPKKSDFEFRRWGIEYKNGKLYDFADKHVVVMSPWPNPRAWIKKKAHGWQCTRIGGHKALSDSLRKRLSEHWIDGQEALPAELEVLDRPEPSEDEKARDEWFKNRQRINQENIAKYLAPIPKHTLEMISEYGDRNWQVMCLFARCPGIEDLHRSNPALVMALANSWAFQEKPILRPMRAARSLVYRKQKHILNWLGFPATEQCRRVLSKIPPHSLRLKDLLYLRHWSRDERVLKLLSHLDCINEGVVSMVTSEHRLEAVTPRLLTDISKLVHKPSMKDLCFWIHDINRMRRRVRATRIPDRFESLVRLKAVHDQLVEQTNRYGGYDYLQLPDKFPGPPFQGTASIWPITTPKDLYEEGVEQRNCVASHADWILDGREYVYRVYHPIRATFSILRTQSGWKPGQLKTAYNGAVPESMVQDIYRRVINSGAFISDPPQDDCEPAREGAQTPLGMTQESWDLVKLVEETFGESSKIELELPA